MKPYKNEEIQGNSQKFKTKTQALFLYLHHLNEFRNGAFDFAAVVRPEVILGDFAGQIIVRTDFELAKKENKGFRWEFWETKEEKGEMREICENSERK